MMTSHSGKTFALTLLCLCNLLFAWNGAMAQEEADSRILARWGVTLDWIELELEDEEAIVTNVDRYDTRLSALIDDAEKFKAQILEQLRTPRLELEALGEPPQEGDPSEARDIEAQRDAINTEIAALSQQEKQAELILVRAEQLLQQLGTTQRRQLETRLLTRTPTIYTGAFWSTLAADLRPISRGLLEDVQELLHGQRRHSWTGWLILLLVLSAALTAIPARRWLTQHFGRRPQANESSYSQRTVSAFAEGVASGLLPAAIIGGIGLVLVSQELVGEPSMNLVKAASISLVVAIIAIAPVKAALVPHAPTWRLFSVDSAVAARLTRRLQWLAVFCAVLFFLYMATERYQPYSSEIDVVSKLAITMVVGSLLLSSLNQQFWQAAANRNDDTQSSRLLDTLRRALLGIVAIAMVLGLAGYVELSAFLVSRLAITLLSVCAISLVRRLLHELLARLTTAWQNISRIGREPSRSSMGFWLGGLLDILLLGPVLVMLAHAWGIPEAVIRLWTRRLLEGVSIGELTFSPGRVLLAVLIFSIVFIATRLIRRVVYDRVLPETHMDYGLRHSVYVGIGYMGLALAAVLAILTLGVGLQNMALVFGALSVGIGLGLQGVVSNFMSGLILLAQRPIRVGDWIEVGEHEGIVRNIMSVSTEIETFDNASIIIPNVDLVSNSLVNWTHTDRTIRVIVRIGVAHGSDIHKVQELLLDCASKHPEVLSTPEPYALFMDFGESALAFELRVFIEDAERYPVVSSELRIAMNQACREANIEIPYPQRRVHLDSGRGVDMDRDMDKDMDKA